MSSLSRRCAALLLPIALVGCSHFAPKPPIISRAGVTVNSGGDTRGTVLYHPPLLPKALPNPYLPVSDKFVIGQRQQMAWALAEIDYHAHLQALHAYPIPDPSWKGYTKEEAVTDALRQAQFNAYLLEKYHARFCNQYHITYDQMLLIIKEAREKNWPLPPAPKEE